MGVSTELLARRIREGLDAIETKCFVRQWPKPWATSESETAAELIRRDVVAFAERRAMVELVIKSRVSSCSFARSILAMLLST